MNSEKIGKFIYQLRTEKGLSQYQLADKIPISRQAVSKWERAQTIPDSSTLIRLSELFEVSINELLKGERLSKNSIEQLEKTTLSILDESNRKTKTIKSIFLTFTIIISTLVFIFLTYYFINSYNAIKIYTLSGSNDDFIITEGLFITTKKKTYMKLGKIISNYPKEINNIKVYYKQGSEEKSIFEDIESDKTIMDLYGYEEYFPQKDISTIIKNTYVEITDNNGEKETLKLIFEKDFAPVSIFFIQKENKKINTSNSSNNELIEEEAIKVIKEKGKQEENNYILTINKEDTIINFIYTIDTNQIIIAINDETIGTIIAKKKLYICPKLTDSKTNCKKQIKTLFKIHLNIE